MSLYRKIWDAERMTFGCHIDNSARQISSFSHQLGFGASDESLMDVQSLHIRHNLVLAG